MPVVYLWSETGVVPRESADRAVGEIGESASLSTSATAQAHVEDPEAVASAVQAVDP